MARTSETPAQELEIVAPDAQIVPAAEVPLHNRFHRNAMLAAAQSAGWLVLAGAELARRKKALKHGEWEGWVEANCEFNIRTAQRYISLAEGVRDKMLREASKTTAVSFLELLSTSADQLSPAGQLTLLKAVHKLTDGETVQQLYLDFGIVKKPQGSATKGGDKGGGGEESEDTPQQAAIDIWRTTLKALLYDGLTTKSWVDLPDTGEVSRETLAAVLLDLSKQLRDATPEQKGGGK